MKFKNRKAISFITALMLISGSLNVMPQCMSTVSAQSTVSDIINIVIPENTYAANGMFTITYDAEKLKLESTSTGDSNMGMMTIVNTKEAGKAVIGFAGSKAADISKIAFSLSFSRIGDSSEDISELCSMTIDELITLDSDGNEVNVDHKNIKLEKKVSEPPISEPVLKAEQIDSGEDGKYTAAISFCENTYVTNGILFVKYDTSHLKFESAETGDNLKNGMVEVNEVSDGTLKIAFISNSPISSSGEAVKLTFSSLKADSTEILVSADEFSSTALDGTITPINTNTASCTISTTETAVSDAQISVSSNSNSSEAYIDIAFSDNTGVTNGILTVNYDPSHLKFESSEACDILKNAMIEVNETSKGTLKIAFLSNEEITSGGNALRIFFTSLTEGKSEVSVSADEFSSTALDGTITPINVNTASCSITTSTSINYEEKYDLNDDGIVTASDIVLIVKYILGKGTTDAETIKKADINENGTVDVFDLIRFKRYMLEA